MEEKIYSISEAMNITGLSRTVFDKALFKGKIGNQRNEIRQTDIDRILEDKKMYISLYEFACMHENERFSGNNSADRKKLLEYMEENNFWNLEVKDLEEVLIADSKAMVYFNREDVPVLDEKLVGFFNDFAVPVSEKIKYLIASTKGHKETKENLERLMNFEMKEQSSTPSFGSFVEIVLSAPNVLSITNDDIRDMMQKAQTQETKRFIAQWLNFAKTRYTVKYGDIKHNKKESISLSAYSMDTYFSLAKCFFNAEYIHSHQMIENALENHMYAEMWLYLTLFYTCGWRASDVCNGWHYLHLKEHPGCFGLNEETLYEDILNDAIPDETYENVCKYALGSIEISGKLASKTAKHGGNTLLAVITPELHTFYGLLTLIGESHMLRSGDGYMKSSRASEYQNKMNLAAFFGSEITEILHGKNILSRRLNKDYLQAVESEGRKMGYGGIMTSALASFARNHKSYDTIKIYLKDHKYTAETAECVLYCLAQRGVFGFELYQTLLTAYPEAMNSLTMKEQTNIMEQINVRPFLVEQAQSGILASEEIKSKFVSGDEKQTMIMLHSMFEISQMRGKGKDSGIYCLKRACGEACGHPEWRSCIANACSDLVFSRYGYIPLVEVLRDYGDRAKLGDKKALAVLQKVLIPRYQNIINAMIREFHFSSEEQQGLEQLTAEVLKENG